MLDLSLTREQEELPEPVRSFADERILPVVAEKNDINHVHKGIIDGMAEMSLMGASIPEEYGGLGLDFVSLAIIAEEIERGDAAFKTLLSVHLALNSMSMLESEHALDFRHLNGKPEKNR